MNRLKDLREDADLSQRALAEKMYMHTTQYQRYETGESDLPLEWAKKFAKFFNVSIDYIANLIPTPQPLIEKKLSAQEMELLLSFKNADAKTQKAIKILLDI